MSPNPRPAAVVWAGPLFGVLAPVAAWLTAMLIRRPSAYLWRFFAGFCLIANGAYIGSGAIDPVGDAADLVRLGTPAWLLAAFGLATIPAGLALWHGQAASFGSGAKARPVPVVRARAMLALLLAVVIAELIWSAGPVSGSEYAGSPLHGRSPPGTGAGGEGGVKGMALRSGIPAPAARRSCTSAASFDRS